MYDHKTFFMIMALGASALACTVEDAEGGELARAALVEEANEDVLAAVTDHAACTAEPGATCEATEDELAAALEHLHELQRDELVFRTQATISCLGQTLTCSGVSCWAQDETACICQTATGGLDIDLCIHVIEE